MSGAWRRVPSQVANRGLTFITPFAVPQCLHLSCADAGGAVYLYEFQHPPAIFKNIRPGFVKADHGDDIYFVFGAPLWNGQTTDSGTAVDASPYPITGATVSKHVHLS